MVIVLSPFKFTDHYYRRLEIDVLRGHLDVVVWDISQLIDRTFHSATRAPSSAKQGVLTVTDMRQFLALVRGIDGDVWRQSCVMSFLRPLGPAALRCNLVIKRTGARVIEYYNAGTPVQQPPEKISPRNIRGKVRRLLASRLSASGLLKAYVGNRIYPHVADLLCAGPTHRLVAGSVWERICAPAARRNGIALVRGSSWDYSNALLRDTSGDALVSGVPRMAVLLDGAGPRFASDDAFMRRRPVLTSGVWYPALRRFLTRVERETGTTVVVAGHPQSAFSEYPPDFGGRRVVYGRTEALVRQSEFVITRHSTAISYAVMHKKPVISIYNNQLQFDVQTYPSIKAFAEVLGGSAVNIDTDTMPITPRLRIDERKRHAFKAAYLTSVNPARSNAQVLLEDVMGIPFAAPMTVNGGLE